jgi:regulator of sigma D
MNPQELIVKLKEQHLTLQADLASALEYANSLDGMDSRVILEVLQKFKTDLTEHLQLENENFYPDYFNKKSLLDSDVDSEQIFHGKMNEIGTAVMNFLDKYSTPESLNNPSEFKTELSGIIDTLKLRIETEEEGIFDIYLSM